MPIIRSTKAILNLVHIYICNHNRIQILLFLFLFSLLGYSQKGIIIGKVVNAKTNHPVDLVHVTIQGMPLATVTDSIGNFKFQDVEPGFYRLSISLLGYELGVSPEIQVQGNHIAFIEIPIQEKTVKIKEITVSSNILQRRKIEAPLSFQAIGVQQIEKAAGANRDVSKALQALPGVGSTDPNRNDLIVRGGGPSENVFYLDGIEIPVINHFATQGSSGGAVGIINPDFVREINFYTGSFPANRLNALSSVMEIKQKNGSEDKIHSKISVGASDAAITIDGPSSKKTTFIASARQSYLQFLFKAIGLPFLPTYNDFQIKIRSKIDEKDELNIIGIGAIDNMTLNTELQESGTENQRYILNYLPIYKQWNYAIGATYKHFSDTHIDNWVLSRNMLQNHNYKFLNNDESKAKTSDYVSDEAENKLRFERVFPYLPLQLNVGAGLKYIHYTNNTFRSYFSNQTSNTLSYATNMDLWGYNAFAQASKTYWDERLKLSLGLNLVGINFNSKMANALNQISPRFSVSYAMNEKIDINANIGRYASQPAYTTMGLKDVNGNFANKNNRLTYIYSNQAIAGIDFHPSKDIKATFEGFFKHYDHYPLSLTDGISIASKGTDYGQVGDEAIASSGIGKTYGVEFLLKFIEWQHLNLTATYTLFRSEFTDSNGLYRPSSWDVRSLINILASYRLNPNWNIACRWHYTGGRPYSPIDWTLSSNRQAWAITHQAYIDYKQFNSLRLPATHQLDIRIDKEFYFKKWIMNFYVDVQNVYNAKNQGLPVYTNLDLNGNVLPSPDDNPQKQSLRQIKINGGTILPTLGIIVKI